MLNALSTSWVLTVLRGGIFFAFGLISFFRGASLDMEVIAALFAGLTLVETGILIGCARTKQRENRYWPMLVLQALVSLLAAVGALLAPGTNPVALLFVIAGWVLITGVMDLFVAIQLRKDYKGEWILTVKGLVSLFTAFLLLLKPTKGAIALLWVVGGYALLMGILLVFLGFRLRGMLARQTGQAPSGSA
jgi:uncharacterized membrane protein HdeD (DUF308 family)